ncbi:MAG TPA: hypothetical protein VI485_09510 [Vicinamibacterales bacterium]|nr:hypothetical protein [Vicinamibacterales bacterium]
MHRRSIVLGLLSAMCTAVISCKAIRHDEHVAAAKAEEFLRVAVIDRNSAAAYAMLSLEARTSIKESTFVETVEKMHPNGYPAIVRATEYEPVPGQSAIQVFLEGESGVLKYYYRVAMSGNVDAGYAPSAMFRGNQAYPPSPLRQSLSK